jgi:hypothetical protein
MCRRGPGRRMMGRSRVVNRASSPDYSLTRITPQTSYGGLRRALDVISDVRTAPVAGHPGARAVTQDGLRAVPAVPAVPSSKVAASLAVRRWQLGQSAEGNLQANGQYTNLSVRQ